MTTSDDDPVVGTKAYEEAVAEYDPDLDDPDDDTTGYENDVDALGEEGVE